MEIKNEDGKREKYYLYYDGETVAGTVSTINAKLLNTDILQPSDMHTCVCISGDYRTCSQVMLNFCLF